MVIIYSLSFYSFFSKRKTKTNDLIATTPCILRELQQLGENFRGIFIAARRFPKENCKHEGNVEPNECLKALVGKVKYLDFSYISGDSNDGKVIIASQDYELIQQLRNIPGVRWIFKGNLEF